jgi:hypothetical protein
VFSHLTPFVVADASAGLDKSLVLFGAAQSSASLWVARWRARYRVHQFCEGFEVFWVFSLVSTHVLLELYQISVRRQSGQDGAEFEILFEDVHCGVAVTELRTHKHDHSRQWCTQRSASRDIGVHRGVHFAQKKSEQPDASTFCDSAIRRLNPKPNPILQT